MKKAVIFTFMAFLLTGFMLSGCSSEKCDVPKVKQSYKNVDEYINDYAAFIKKFVVHMKKNMKDGKLQSKKAAEKWLSAYRSIQSQGYIFKGDEKKKLEKELAKVVNANDFMKHFVPFNKAAMVK